jgi:hypothetical protein
MAHQIKFEDTNTLLCVLEAANGSTFVDVDDIALVLRKNGRKWMDQSDFTVAERKCIVSMLDNLVGETVSEIKRFVL